MNEFEFPEEESEELDEEDSPRYRSLNSNTKKNQSKLEKPDMGLREGRKKGMAKRLWNEKAEITVLKSMIDFNRIKGNYSFVNLGDFCAYVENVLHIDVTWRQLYDKIRCLKRKYLKIQNKTEEEKAVAFSKKPHEELFKLSEKIWRRPVENNDDPEEEENKDDDDLAVNDCGMANSEVREKTEEEEENKDDDDQARNDCGMANSEVRERTQEEAQEENKDDDEALDDCGIANGEVKEKAEAEEDFWSLYPCLNESLNLEEFSGYTLPSFVKQKMSCIGNSKAKELEEKWRKLQVAEIKAKLMRAQLIQEQTYIILEAISQ